MAGPIYNSCTAVLLVPAVHTILQFAANWAAISGWSQLLPLLQRALHGTLPCCQCMSEAVIQMRVRVSRNTEALLLLRLQVRPVRKTPFTAR
jgi:hypothetical protein